MHVSASLTIEALMGASQLKEFGKMALHASSACDLALFSCQLLEISLQTLSKSQKIVDVMAPLRWPAF